MNTRENGNMRELIKQSIKEFALNEGLTIKKTLERVLDSKDKELIKALGDEENFIENLNKILQTIYKDELLYNKERILNKYETDEFKELMENLSNKCIYETSNDVAKIKSIPNITIENDLGKKLRIETASDVIKIGNGILFTDVFDWDIKSMFEGARNVRITLEHGIYNINSEMSGMQLSKFEVNYYDKRECYVRDDMFKDRKNTYILYDSLGANKILLEEYRSMNN